MNRAISEEFGDEEQEAFYTEAELNKMSLSQLVQEIIEQGI